MAKSTYQTMQMVPEEKPETGTKYMVRVPGKGTKSGKKIRLKKYDPVLRTHVWFVTKKLPSHKK